MILFNSFFCFVCGVNAGMCLCRNQDFARREDWGDAAFEIAKALGWVAIAVTALVVSSNSIPK